MSYAKASGFLKWISDALLIGIELAISLLVGSGLVVLGLGGAAWILGGIIAGALVFSVHRSVFVPRSSDEPPLQPNRTARKIGQMIVGLAIGLSLQHHYFDTIAAHFPILMSLPLYLVICCGAIGAIYARLEHIDLLTGWLATTPGNIGIMASLAADYGKNAPLVSLTQLMRFTSVILIMPIIANVTATHPTNRSLPAFLQQLTEVSPSDVLLSSMMLLITALFVYWGNALKIPMAAFLGAIAIGLLFDNIPFLWSGVSAIDLQLPLAFNLIGQVLLGITIGEYWGMNPLLKLATIARAVVPVGLMFVAALIAAKIMQLVTAWSWLTCLLMAAPGGSPEMIWIALTLHQDTELITTGHIVRLLLINLTLPLLISLGETLNRYSTSGEAESAAFSSTLPTTAPPPEQS
ncbi:MAG: AbrB family transcriptional regulator [Scytolyngbya sp. HA4215-MV1]|jgi:hypothetical protein|nr:AbrB family transcriptional regulator [Scytolyngbya sp. HA4215-MV1]